MKACLYIVRDLASEQIIYIGKTTNPKKRWGRHLSYHDGRLYKYMIENGGLQNFVLVPLIWFETEELAFEAEEFFIQIFLEQRMPLLNHDRGGLGSVSGWHHSDQTIQKLSKIQTARMLDQSCKDKIIKYFQENREVWLSNLKTSMSTLEVREKISDARIQQYRLLSTEARKELTKKATEAISGTKLTQERKNQLSESRKRWFQNNPSAREEVSKRRKGKKHTESSKRQIALKRMSLSQEQISICQKLHSEGVSMKHISDVIGTSVKPVFNLINKRGIYKDLNQPYSKTAGGSFDSEFVP